MTIHSNFPNMLLESAAAALSPWLPSCRRPTRREPESQPLGPGRDKRGPAGPGLGRFIEELDQTRTEAAAAAAVAAGALNLNFQLE